MIRLEAPIPTIGTMLVSVKRQSLPEHEKEGTDLLVVKPSSIRYKRQTREGRAQDKISGLLHSPSKNLHRSKPKEKFFLFFFNYIQ